MDERALLLLGILRSQSQHTYQINEFIERNLARMTDMKKPTAYAILDRLCQAGYVSVRTEQERNRPPRKVYTITSAGERAFEDLLRRTLAEPDRHATAGDLGLMFVDALPRAEALALLLRRQAALREQIVVYTAMPQHKNGLGVDLAFARQLALLRADAAWLEETIRRLELAEEGTTSR